MQYLILYLLLFSLPFQSRILLVSGLNEYQSIFLYATDILVGLFFLFFIITAKFTTIFGDLFTIVSKYPKLIFFALLLISWFILSSIFSDNVLLGFYKTVKITEGILLFFYFLSLPQTVYGNALTFLIASGIFQTILALGQFIMQRDLGLLVLGENILSPDIAGVAKLDVWGEKIIRAYGTFPHPNVLAAFLLFCLFLAFFSFREKRSALYNQFIILAIPLITLGLLLTFSRAVIFIGILALLCWFFIAKTRPLCAGGIFLLSFTAFSLLLYPYLMARFSFSLQDQAISLRVFYVKNAFSFIREHPFLGVGSSQFTLAQKDSITKLNLPSWANQPVHNIYLLIASETGIIGAGLFIWFLIRYFRSFYHKEKRIFLLRLMFPFSILIIGFFDHFFFTYQQGILLLWSSLAFFYETRR